MSNNEAFRPSPHQEHQWTIAPDGPAGCTQVTLAVAGAIDPTALDAVVGRHEILRTTFSRRPGIRLPVQVVHDELAPGWSESDLGDVDPAQQPGRVASLAAEERARPFDLDQGPLIRAHLVRLAPERQALVLTASSLCLDAATVPALVAEVAAAAGAGAAPPEEPFQYADYAEWQHELADSEDEGPKAGRDHWADHEGVRSPEVLLPEDEAGAHAIDVAYDAGLAAAVTALATRYGTSPETVVHAGWHALLARLSGADEIVTALRDGGPGRDPLDGLIGPSGRAVPLRTAVSPETTFAELLARVDRTRSDALGAEDYAPMAAA
ncbi:MAG: hypothetical protein QOI80_1905, partial [Solirubrobacteraceae bacterium]|nr:hypothetical protein [Solirubrobacteraceae bacterium]